MPGLTVDSARRLQTSATSSSEGIAIIELFAGLRTAKLAAESAGYEVHAHLSCEKCPFANALAQEKHGPLIVLAPGEYKVHVNDVCDITERNIHTGMWIASVYQLPNVAMVLLVGGWPCKGTSRARDTGTGFESRPGLADKNSALFWQLPRIR